MSATMQSPETTLRKFLPAAFSRLSKEQVMEICELFVQYGATRDPEILDTMVEFLVPETLGVVSEPEVEPAAAEQLDKFQARIGSAIRTERVKKGWTQEQLAQKAGLKQTHISRLEAGVHTPTDLTVQKIADALGVPPSALDPGW